MFIIDEGTDACEWEYFAVGYICPNHGTKAIVDFDDRDPDTDEPFHYSHGCDDHAQRMLTIAKRGKKC